MSKNSPSSPSPKPSSTLLTDPNRVQLWEWEFSPQQKRVKPYKGLSGSKTHRKECTSSQVIKVKPSSWVGWEGEPRRGVEGWGGGEFEDIAGSLTTCQDKFHFSDETPHPETLPG